MKGQLTVSSPEQYLEKVDASRKEDMVALDALIRKLAPKLERFILNGMLAYGRFHYKYGSGREGDWGRIILASNKNYISLYVSPRDAASYIPDEVKKALPKASIGRGCVRFRRLSDLDSKPLARLIKSASKP